MAHCAYCKTTQSGYDDGHWENLFENLLLCRSCVEDTKKAFEIHGMNIIATLEKELGTGGEPMSIGQAIDRFLHRHDKKDPT
jgi:hypothetical protein